MGLDGSQSAEGTSDGHLRHTILHCEGAEAGLDGSNGSNGSAKSTDEEAAAERQTSQIEGSGGGGHDHSSSSARVETVDYHAKLACTVVGPGCYLLGIIDILQTWDYRKRAERLVKTLVLCQDGNGISAVNPTYYAERFQDKMEEIM
jgi:1-phosphatidylinositol-4-phosphate 5-kinase